MLAIRVLIIFALSIPLVSTTYAVPSGGISKIRGEYIRLRNIDPSGDDPIHRKSWEALSSRVRELIVQNQTNSDAGALRLLGAETQLRLYRSTRNHAYLTTALAMIKPALTDPGVDKGEAALVAGDVSLYSGAEDAARNYYEQAQSSSGRYQSLATQRLRGLKNGTFKRFLPSQDREVPRLIKGRESRIRAASGSIIVLDPGHGGSDAGAVSPFGGEEKEITLDVARRVKALLERRYQLKVQLTRDEDIFVPLARRTAFANRKSGAVFVSLHVNASEKHDADGLEAYYLDNTNDEASRKLAERENGISAGAEVDDLSFMLSDLIQTGKLEDSIHLTRDIESSMKAKVLKSNHDLRSLGVKKAPFFVLVGAHMPCSLIEMFFVDHPVEGKRLKDDNFRSALAAGVADGIHRFVMRK